MDLRLILAILLGKFIARLIKITGGGATAAPGLYALKFDPGLVRKLAKNLKLGSIVISGTNGKTTTARLTGDILSSKFKIIHNRQGSNLLRGIASTLISQSSIFGKINKDLGLWEIDEATLPEAVSHLAPRIIVILNLFRDQLDRYGEVDSIRNKWQQTLSRTSQKTTVILNADDPGVSIFKNSFKGKTLLFGIESTEAKLPKVESVADIKHCLICGSTLVFTKLLSAHLGHYLCNNCHLTRPQPQIVAKNVKFASNFSTRFKCSIDSKPIPIKYSLPGLYNVYNVLAAISIAQSLKIERSIIVKKIKSFSAAFGRFQKVKIKNKQIIIFLIKNPAGANEIIRTVSRLAKVNLLAILNDNIADGRDVSWIWDTNWEVLANKAKKIWVSGIRAWDLTTRLKYAGFRLSKNNVCKDINYSTIKSLEILSNKDTLIILPTYTALLSLQRALHKMGGKISKWQEN